MMCKDSVILLDMGCKIGKCTVTSINSESLILLQGSYINKNAHYLCKAHRKCKIIFLYHISLF